MGSESVEADAPAATSSRDRLDAEAVSCRWGCLGRDPEACGVGEGDDLELESAAFDSGEGWEGWEGWEGPEGPEGWDEGTPLAEGEEEGERFSMGMRDSLAGSMRSIARCMRMTNFENETAT